MSYREYVIAAYAVFAVVLAWDYAAPRMRIAQQLRAARRQAAHRGQRRAPGTNGDLKR